MTNFLRQRRTAMRVSQEQLANQLGVSQQTVARWETTGQIPAKHIKDLAVVMGARVQDFLPRSEESPSRPVIAGGGVATAADASGEEDDSSLPFGDINLHFSGAGAEEMRSYPITWGTLNDIQEQLGDVGSGLSRTAPWVNFKTLNNKWIALNTAQLERVTFVDDDAEAMTCFEHKEVYKAARELWDRLPLNQDLDGEDSRYSVQLVARVESLVQELGQDVGIELDGLTCEFVSGKRLSKLLNADVVEALEAMFGLNGEDDLQPNRFLNLRFEDYGSFEVVRLGSVRLIEAALLAFEDDLEQLEGGAD